MTAETLLSAARRVVRFTKIDETRGGGLISIETVKAVQLLDEQVRIESARQGQNGEVS